MTDQEIHIKKSVLSDSLAEGAILLDLEKGTYFGLNEVGRRVWELVKAQKSLRQIVATVIEEYAVEEDRFRKDLDRFLQLLKSQNLIEDV